MRRSLSITLLLLYVALGLFAQTPAELSSSIRNGKDDTAKVHKLLALSHHCEQRPGELAHDLDTALLLLGQAENLCNKLDYTKGTGLTYLEKSHVLNEKKDKAGAREYATKAMDVFTKVNFHFEYGMTCHHLSTCIPLDTKENIDERIELEHKALAAYERAANKEEQGGACLQLGELYQVKGDFNSAIVYLRKCLVLWGESGHLSTQGVHDLLGHAYRRVGLQEEALKHALEAIRVAELVNDTTMQLATIYNRAALTYMGLKDDSSGLACLQKSLPIARKYNDINAIHFIAINTVSPMWRLKREKEALAFLTDIYTTYPPAHKHHVVSFDHSFLILNQKVKDFAKARYYADKLVQYDKEGHIWPVTYLQIYAALIPYYIEMGSNALARVYIKKLSAMSDLEPKDRLFIYQSNFRVDSAEGKYISAIRNYQQFKELTDSVFNQTRSKQIEQLKISYETDKKDRDLVLKESNIKLLTQEKDLQAAKLRQGKVTRNITLAGIGALLLLAGLLYSRYRIKQRSNRQLEAKQEVINEKNTHLQNLVREKEWLLREIHHRVKNNLQVVTGLLNSQSAFLTDEAAMAAIRNSQHRVNSMSLIHQQLYQSDNMASISMPEYIEQLVGSLEQSFSTGNQIWFELDTDPLKLDVSQAVPIGLILNEAITNAIKYAFPGKNGTIAVSLKQAEGDQYELRIADNGVGLPAGFDQAKTNSLGIPLMQGLSEDIDGQFFINQDNGTVIRVVFNCIHLVKIKTTSEAHN